jgi:hypothetical protein
MTWRRGFDVLCACVLATVGLCVVVQAEPLPREQIPEPLKPWIDWVLRGHEQDLCPYFEGTADRRQCAWPARLVLELDEKSGRFSQQWRAYSDAWIPLPGDARRWPLDVRIDGKPTPAVVHDGAPALHLSRGKHEISGSFAWSELPELLSIPAETGLVALSLDGKAVPFARRDPQGQLWLKSRPSTVAEEARLDIRVYRRVTDDIPLEITTAVELRVSGNNREVVLGRALPDEFVAMTLGSPLPARLESDGHLRVQVRPGTWTIEIRARHLGPVATLALPPKDGPWAPEEIWVFDARSPLRVVSIEGVPSIDPQQTELPPDWMQLPAYPMRPGSIMRLTEKRRGDAVPAPDQLSMRRTWWLDFDGNGYTIKDEISGTLSQSWRLEMPPPTVLGRVSLAGRDQLITRSKDPATAGVEIRQSQLQMEAESRLMGSGARIPAVGWNEDFQQVSGVLNLPPGWRLFNAAGVDDVSSTWVTDWTLLDLFLVLIIAMAAARVWGLAWGVVALATLTLTYLEPDAPRWLWLALLAAEALLSVLPSGRFRSAVRLYRGAVLVAFVIVVVPFMVKEIRSGMYPALETSNAVAPFPTAAAVGGVMAAKNAAVAAPQAMMGLERAPQARALRAYEEAPGLAGGRPSIPGEEYRYVDDKAIVSTGPGLPRWQWRTISLRWRGPVERGQEIRFVLLSPRTNLVLAFLRVALLAALFLKGLRGVAGPVVPRGAALAAAAVAALSSLSVFAPVADAADFPPAELLKTLEQRLLERPDCSPICAASPRLRLEATTTALLLRVEIDAAAETAVPLPGGAKGWAPSKVVLDGEPAEALSQDGNGILWLAVGAGKHQVILDGPIPLLDTVEIPLPLKPHRIDAEVSGWTLSGIREDGLPEDSLRLVRERRGESTEPRLEPGFLPPFARLERELRLGLSWEVENVVTRLTPLGTAFHLEVPLLAGESVTGNVRVENGKALVVLGPSANQARWRSILKEAPTIDLEASENEPWTEVWRLDASPLWHVAASGIPPIHQPPNVRRIREWRPWPGETVSLALARPEAFPGQTLTIDRSSLEMSPGRRSTDVTLSFELRSSRGGQHIVTLPQDAELQSVAVNGAPQPIRQDKRAVTLPIVPGAQTIGLVWRSPHGIGARVQSPDLDLGAASVNVDTTIHVPADRWTLAAGGGRLGPAVLFWSLLLVVLLASIVLGRIESTPLGTIQWSLLGVGLTQAPIWVAVIVAGWLLALGWRLRSGAALSDNRFNLVQVGLALWTAAALVGLFVSIERGLLGLPEMQISGNGSTAQALHWYHDRAGAHLPPTWAISVPLAVYRLAMLAWALWIAWALLSWLRWGFGAFATGGLWRASARAWRLSRKTAPPPSDTPAR